MNTIITTQEVKLDTKPKRTKAAKSVFVYKGNIGVYASVTDAALALGVDIGCVSKTCHGKQAHADHNLMCFVKDIPVHILDIVDAMREDHELAEIYRKAEAERKALEEREARKVELEKAIIEAQEELAKRIENANKDIETMKAELDSLCE